MSVRHRDARGGEHHSNLSVGPTQLVSTLHCLFLSVLTQSAQRLVSMPFLGAHPVSSLLSKGVI